MIKTILSKAAEKRAYILSFFLPALILFVSYIFFGVYPFGERSVLSLDLNAQYVYYYDYMYDVLAGDESIFYSWSRNLSGEFAGIIGYYLASPFNWLVWMFPRTMITEGLLTMMLAKAAAAGLSACFLLRMHRGYSNTTAVVFSTMYALCGFFVVQTMNPMWLDGLISLPLVVMGVERICDKRRFLLYIFSLVYIFVANFYIGYMIGIFSAFYFLYYMASGKSRNKCFGEGCGATIMYGVSSAAAIMMSAFMILPVYKSLSNGKFEFSTPDYTPIENFNIADTFIKLFPTTYDTVRMEGLPILYCGTLTLIFAVVYFAEKRFSARERISGGVLIALLVLSMYIRPVDMMWHGGQLPNWLPYRYSFLLAFLLFLFAAQAFDSIKNIRPKLIGGAFVLLLAVLLLADKQEGHEYFDTNLIIVLPLLVLIVIAIVAYVYRRYYSHPVMKVCLSVIVCIELLLNTVLTLFDMHSDIVFSNRSTYLGDIPYTRKITEQIHELDDGFYRMEKTYHRCVNDPIALRMYGMSHSSSTLNAKSIALLKSLGYSSREHYTRSDGGTMLTDDIFGVKYILSKYACYVPYTDTVDIPNDIKVTVYENADALPIAYLADSSVVGYSFPEFSPFLSQNYLAQKLTGSEELTVMKPADEYYFSSKNITVGTTTDDHHSYRKKNESEDASITFEVTMPADGPLYMYLPTKYERETYMYVNDQYQDNYFKYENFSIAYIGTFLESEVVNIRLELQENAVFMMDPQFYYVDTDELAQFRQIMQAKNAETTVTRNSGSHLTIEVNAAEDCTLFTTIPLEDGWTAYIDGHEAKLASCLDESLMCVDIKKGKHTIVLDFVPAGLKLGLVITAAGVVLLVIMLLTNSAIRKSDAKRAAAAQLTESEEQSEAAEEVTADNPAGEAAELPETPADNAAAETAELPKNPNE